MDRTNAERQARWRARRDAEVAALRKAGNGKAEPQAVSIEQATALLIAAITAAIERIPRGREHHDAEDRFYDKCRDIKDRIGRAAYEVKGRRTLDESQYAYRVEEARAKAKASARAKERRREAKDARHAMGREWLARMQGRPGKALADAKAELFRAHPDHGGSGDAFRKAFRAYEATKARAEKEKLEMAKAMAAREARVARGKAQAAKRR